MFPRSFELGEASAGDDPQQPKLGETWVVNLQQHFWDVISSQMFQHVPTDFGQFSIRLTDGKQLVDRERRRRAEEGLSLYHPRCFLDL